VGYKQEIGDILIVRDFTINIPREILLRRSNQSLAKRVARMEKIKAAYQILFGELKGDHDFLNSGLVWII
jgi:hypothetical protein